MPTAALPDPVRKAVLPVAGLGTRFLPATKATPKEMMPVLDRPVVQWAVQEAAEAGIHAFLFITGRHKRAVEDHFDDAPELEAALISAGKRTAQEAIEQIKALGEFAYVRQRKPLGLGHAVLAARAWIGNEPFAVLLADDLILGASVSATAQLLEVYRQTGCSVVGLMEVPESEV
ncbi:MAG: UTP--glucose-1-phosphate uridylyltransferase, partial [Zetaproteobacteria bacterium]